MVVDVSTSRISLCRKIKFPEKSKKRHVLMDLTHADPGPQCFKYITIQMGSTTVGGVEILGELVDI